MIYSNDKQIRRNYRHYIRHKDILPHTIRDAYKRPSENKTLSFNAWQQYIETLHGYDIRILSANCQKYTIGFLYERNDKTYFGYITSQYNRCCRVEELES